MGAVTDRIAHYLLNRLRRQSIAEIYHIAEEAGLVESNFIVQGDDKSGTAWRVTDHARQLMQGDLDHARRILGRHLQARGASVSANEEDNGIDPHSVRSIARGRCSVVETIVGEGADIVAGDRDILRLIRGFASRPAVADAALALLIARAVGESVPRLERLFAVLRQPNPFIVVKVPVPGFEQRLDRQLERSKILPSKLDCLHGFTSYLSEGALGKARRDKTPVAMFLGKDIAEKSASVVTKSLGYAVLKPRLPILIVDETENALQPLAAGADLVLRCQGIDDALLIELLHVCCGIRPKDAWAVVTSGKIDFDRLGLDHLTLALRPGRTVRQMLDVLDKLGQIRAMQEEEDNKDKTTTSDKKTGRGKASARPSYERIEPVPSATVGEGTSSSANATLRVETLSGYGPARDWALDLQSDLTLWTAGKIDWSDMSTRLLLSSPPGRGKTTFAKALCNTLALPLLATSVGRWLESSYLGDVLSAMSATFEEAKAAAPCILFIDEADNIGRRTSGSRDYGDYWDSLVNRLLELIDGASKTDGVVIVAATNAPEKIDPALLRSGRLERHITIPEPDRQALAGILAHHLGRDLGAVLTSRPKMDSGEGGPATNKDDAAPVSASRDDHTNNNQKGPLT